MKIEVLFPEICYLFGDKANMKYLKQCLPNAEFIETSITDTPKFLEEKIDLIYLGSMTESGQEKVLEKLIGYKNKIIELINNNTIFLLTGNSFEVFLEYIEKENGEKIYGLNIFPDFYAKRYIPKRVNSLFLGKFNDFKIVGYTSRFTNVFGDNSRNYLFEVEKGIGLNLENKFEGLRKNNFMATYLLGPLLIQNPLFTQYILNLLGVNDNKIVYEKEIMEAYNVRIKELNSNIKFLD